jgi:hypothetical protein
MFPGFSGFFASLRLCVRLFFMDSMRPNPGARIPVKVHRRVCLIQLLARKKLAQDLVGRLTERVLLVRPGRVEAVIQELQKMGHTPQKVEGRK